MSLLEERSIPEPNSGCHLWLGAVSGSGYGVVVVRSERGLVAVQAHRYAYEQKYGPISKGLFVCHKCDVKTCVNPDHLWAGTPKENTADMIRKGRRAFSATKNPLRGEAWLLAHASSLKRGEDHHCAKLIPADVIEIRRSPLPGVDLARRFRVTSITISRIRRRLIWRHVGG